MKGNLSFGIFLCLLVIAAVLVAGCSDQSASTVTTPVTTTAPQPKYVAGDIIAKTSAGGDQLYVILNYDPTTDQYERAWIYQNADGSWGHFVNTVTDMMDRSVVEKVYPVRIAHVTVSSIPVVTPTEPVVAGVTYVGDPPSITNITPGSAAQGATVTVTISGNNFQTGATPKLVAPGSGSVTATAVSASSTSITATFDLNNLGQGVYNLIVTDPDGRSDILPDAFTIGNAAPVVNGISPNTVALNDSSTTFTISGQNFETGISVSFLQGSQSAPCGNAKYVDTTTITCGPIFFSSDPGAAAGLWDVQVINIADAQSGTLTQKFTVTNSTSS
jgi:hypothetical protein